MKIMHLRGTGSQNDAYTGSDGTLTLDTENHRFRIHDGLKQGGFEVGTPVVLDGLTEVVPDNVVTYTIINFDSFSTYQVSALNGTATISGDTITYTAPSAEGTDTLKVIRDGVSRSFSIGVRALGVDGVFTEFTGGSTTRAYHTMVEIGGKLYLHAGDGGTYHDDLWEYDPASDTWTQLTGSGVAIMGHSAVAIGGLMYVHGGNGASVTNTLRSYDPQTDTWTELTAGGGNRYIGASCVINDKMYIFGGYDGSLNLNDLWVYDPAVDSWTQLASGATARRSVMGAAVGGKFYIHGGRDAANDTLSDLWVYDPVTDAWTQLTSGPVTNANAAAIGLDGFLYVFAGFGDSGYHDSIWEYDPATDTWTDLGPGSPRQAHAIAVLDTTIYFHGGLTSSGRQNDFWRIA